MLNIPWVEIFNQSIKNPELLPGLLSNYQVNGETLQTWALPAVEMNEAYGRKVLFKNNEIEVMLADWRFQAEASPHNHGQAQGLIWFVQGNFSERHYKFSGTNLVPTDDKFFTEGSIVCVDQNDIHSCRPEKTGLSLHVYSPPIHKMKVWDIKGQRTLTVADNCGAWIPENPSLIIEERPWTIHATA